MSIWTDVLGAEVRFVDVGGVRTRVVTAGEPESRPVVFLHGRGGHLETFERTLSAIAEAGMYALSIDLLGHGLTAQAGTSYDIGELYEHVKSTIGVVLGEREFDVVGQSLGGWIAALLARDDRRIRRIVLIEPAGFQGEEERMSNPDVQLASERGGRAFDQVNRDTVALRFEQLLFSDDQVDPEMVDLRVRLYSITGATAVHKAVRTADNREWLRDPDSWKDESIACLLIHGEHGHLPGDVISRIAAGPLDSVATIPAAKQWPHYENPALVNSLIIHFLEKEKQ